MKRRSGGIANAAKAITSDQMYRIEENGHSGIGMRRLLMMENAGHGISDFIANRFKNQRLKNKKIVAVCGTGNNGGDGLVAVRHLAGYGAKTSVVLLGSPPDIKSEEARLNWGIVEKMDSVEIIFGKEEVSGEVREKILSADIILDGIFGTGIKREIQEPHASAIGAINKSDAYVLAIDVPSGLDPNTGSAYDNAVRADATITFHRMKKGLATKGARKYTGPVHVERIGIPPEAERGVV